MTSIVSEVPSEPELNPEPPRDAGGSNGAGSAINFDSDQGPLGESAQSRLQNGAERPGPIEKHRGRAKRSSLRRHMAIGDVAAVTAAWGALAFANRDSGFAHAVAIGLVAIIVTLVVMRRAGLYRSWVCAVPTLQLVRVLTASAVGTAVYIACDALIERPSVAGPVVAGSVAAAAVLALRWRFGRWLKHRRSTSNFLRSVIMVGTNEDARRLWTLLSEEPELGYRVGAVAGELRSGAPWEDLPSCTEIDGLSKLAEQTRATGVIVVGSALDATDRKRTVDEALAAGLHVQIWPGLDGVSSRRTRMSPVSGVPLLYVEPKEIATWQLAVKRGADLVLAALLSLLTAPLMIAAAIAIKLRDRGPVIYRSPRVGRYGATILVWKFRTMVPNASKMMVDIAAMNERTGGPLFKATDDPRVTKVGRILRSTSIDELPQLWNVFNGTMSLVGPRPALLDEVEQFDDELRRRHEMRPGITGLWQVEARDNPSFSAYRRLDLAYVDDWSLGLDAAILAGTAHQLVVRSLSILGDRRGRDDAEGPSSGPAAVPEAMCAELGSEPS